MVKKNAFYEHCLDCKLGNAFNQLNWPLENIEKSKKPT